MKRQFFSEKLLLRRLKSDEEGVTFLFGSAFSAVQNGSGIPNVAQVTDIIEEYIDELDLLDDYEEYIGEANDQDKYQNSFAFLSAINGADSTREVVKRVVTKNIDTETGNQRIPQTIIDFVQCVKESKIKVNNIITTNFDTLIEEQFDNEGIGYNSVSIVSDSNIIDNNNGLVNIIHLHGIWNKGDTMHTRNQLEAKRDKIEASLRNHLAEQHVVIMAYSGWTDSFTRTLASIVNDDKAEYKIAWCFYEKEAGVIDRNNESLFETLTPAINRDRIQFFKGIDCRNVFSNSSPKYNVKKQEKKLAKQSQEEINYYLIENKSYSGKIRGSARQEAITILNNEKSVFIESGLGFGLYDFISSLIYNRDKNTKFLKVDLSDVISKKQIDDKVKSDTGHYLSSLILLLSSNRDAVHFIIFDKIRRNADPETILHLLSLQEIFNVLDNNIFFIFSSTVNISQLDNIRVQLKELTVPETGVILRDHFGSSRFTNHEINQIYEKSEGIVTKLEQIMVLLENSSAQEVLSQNEIFDDTFYSESIPSRTIKQIELLINDPNKELTFRMLKILSILKNGETLSNLRKDKMGVKLGPKNTTELIKLELANTLYIDRTTTIVRINPIIKDYILSEISTDEKFRIANAYLQVSVIETKNGVKLNSINRKIYDHGYNTEEDNTNTLLKFAIQECKDKIENESNEEDEDTKELNRRRLNKLLYLSRAYIYILSSSSRFNETISAFSNLFDIVKDVDADNSHKYYFQIAYAHRMMSNYDEADYFIQLSEELCPATDKKTSESIYVEKLYLLEDKDSDSDKALALAKSNKKLYHKNSAAYIASEIVIAHSKIITVRNKALEKLEKRSRKLGYNTLANNIVLTQNKERNDVEKIDKLNEVIKSDNSAYNVCRAIIYKNEVLVRNKEFGKIKDSDIERLRNIYNYLFRQKFDTLFSRCHSILWEIAEYNKNNELIFIIFYTSTIVWKLNSDVKNEEKYKGLFNRLEQLDTMPLIGNAS